MNVGDLKQQNAVINVAESELGLRFPAGQFCDIVVDGLISTPEGSESGFVRVRRWTDDEINRYWSQTGRWDRFGRHVANVILGLNRSLAGDGLVQRVAARLDVPFTEPVDRSTLIANAVIIGAEVCIHV